MITDTAVHEIDMVRWMFGEEIAATTVLTPRRSRNGGELQDPLVLLLEMASGVLVDVEISVNIRYGYDIRGEVVGEERYGRAGRASAGPGPPGRARSADRVPADWRERFVRAYDVELQEWVDAVGRRRPARPERLGRLRRGGGRPTPAWRRCGPASGCRSSLADRPALYEK